MNKNLTLLKSTNFTEEHKSANMHLKVIEGVLIGEYLPPNGEMSLEFCKKAFFERMRFTDGRRFPFLLNVRKIDVFDKKARDYSAKEEVAGDILIAALYTDSAFTKTLANFWLQINKPKTPTKLFTSEQEAFDWLKKEAKVLQG